MKQFIPLLTVLCAGAACVAAEAPVHITCVASAYGQTIYRESHSITLSTEAEQQAGARILLQLAEMPRSLFLGPDEPCYAFELKDKEGKIIKGFVIRISLLGKAPAKEDFPELSERQRQQLAAITQELRELFEAKLGKDWQTLYPFK